MKSAVALSEAEQARMNQVHALAAKDAAGVPSLLPLLSEASWSVRREVVAALANAGQPAVGPLCEALKVGRSDETRIAAAVDALASSTADVYPEVFELASNGDPAVVADAAQVLGRRRNPKAVPVLTELVGHRDDNVAVAAIEALGRIGGRSGVDTLITMVKSRNFFRVFPAIDVLGRSGDPRVIAPLAELLQDSTYLFEAARALGRTGETAAIGPIAALLGHPSESVMRVAAVSLWELKGRYTEKYGASDGPDQALGALKPSEAALRRIVNCLSQADADEQVALSWVLGAFGGDGAVAGLKTLLDGAPRVAEAAAQTLKRMGRYSDEQIREALRDGGSARRQVLLRSITRATAAPAVVECLTDADATVRALACDTLARIGSTSSVPSLFRLLGDENPRVTQAAIGAIQALGTVESRRLALQAGTSDDRTVRWAAFRIMAYFGQREALPLFLGALDGGDGRLRDAAIAGLAFLDVPRALEALLDCAKKGDDRTRSAAARALGQWPTPDTQVEAALLRGVHDADAWVRYYACQSLGRLKLENATAHIAPLLADEAGQVRVSAVEALAHFTNTQALDALKRAAEGADEDVQRAALVGLGGSKRPEAFAVLSRAASSHSPATRLVAISAIAESGSSHALFALSKAVRDPDDDVRSAALGYVAAVPTVDATTLLIELMRDRRDLERISEILATPNEGRVAGITAALENADDELAPALTSALVRLKTPDAREALFKVMGFRDVAARKAAAPAIAAFRTPAAYAELQRACEQDPDPRVRQICQVLIAQ
ncbi:MAG: HEAT repeat domain-containing protein [Archangiaceae bacterium]|nr:HEAT repeat domain-containing protein [Archangiaceae bacterium]